MIQIILSILAFIILGIFILARIAKAKMKNTPLVADHQNILTLTDQNFKHQTKNKLVLVDFWASWCVPCRMMAPVLNEVADELQGNSRVAKINIEQFQGIATQLNVRNIPTLVLFKNGKEVNRFVGIKSKDFLLKELAKAQ
ncbi:thioredoxin [Sunxiuqinia sp. A32]|uniref:thioredoxin n=1 Tax=Sunxiuqinia sp. A32 TaxID=3461496 RepID=UPI00404609BD